MITRFACCSWQPGRRRRWLALLGWLIAIMTDTACSQRANRVSAAAASDRGRLRTGNEDRHYVDVDRGVFLVVDGVGGHAAR